MPNCMKEGWGQAGVWKSPIGGEQDKPFIASKRMMTPLHPQTRPSAPTNSLNTGGFGMSCNPSAFKITLGSSSAPCLSAWMEDKGGGKGNTSLSLGSTASALIADPSMKPAGGNGVWFGSRPMWAMNRDKRMKQMASQAQAPLKMFEPQQQQRAASQWNPPKARQMSSEPQLQQVISLRSPAEQRHLMDAKKACRRGEATPETLTPASSRPASSGGSRGSAERRNRSAPRGDPTYEATTTPLASTIGEHSMSKSNTGQRLASLLSESMSSSFKSHCVCHGQGLRDDHLLDLPDRSQQGHGTLDQMLSTSRRRGDLYAGNIHKGSRGTMLGA